MERAVDKLKKYYNSLNISNNVDFNEWLTEQETIKSDLYEYDLENQQITFSKIINVDDTLYEIFLTQQYDVYESSKYIVDTNDIRFIKEVEKTIKTYEVINYSF